MTWATPAESLLLSAVEGWTPNVTFVVGERPALLRMGVDSFRAASHEHSLEWLDERYFELDTTAGYREANPSPP